MVNDNSMDMISVTLIGDCVFIEKIPKFVIIFIFNDVNLFC